MVGPAIQTYCPINIQLLLSFYVESWLKKGERIEVKNMQLRTVLVILWQWTSLRSQWLNLTQRSKLCVDIGAFFVIDTQGWD